LERKPNNFPDDIIDLESAFLEDYNEMNRFIIFFEKVKRILTSNENIKIIELKLTRILPETSKIFPFSYIISRNSIEYLFFLNNEPEPKLTLEELSDYENLFTKNTSQMGIIIVWNDANLSSVKFYRDEIYKKYEEIIEILNDKDRLLSLEELLNTEIGFSERFSEVTVPPPTEDFKHIVFLNLEKELIDNINDSFDFFKTRRFKEPKKGIMRTINFEDLKPIYSLFEEFMTVGIEIKEIDEIIKRLQLIEEEE